MDQAEKLTRPIVQQLDDILGTPFKVLDDGFIRVVDYMGSDESIVQAARVSYGKGTKKSQRGPRTDTIFAPPPAHHTV